VTPLKTLFTTYDLPLREDAFGDVTLDIDANEKEAVVKVLIDGKKILKAEKDGFNVDSLHLNNRITYLIDEGKLTVRNEGNVTTPYTKNLRLDNTLTFQNGKLAYKGEVIPGPLEGIDGNYTQPLDDLTVAYEGNISSIVAMIDSKGLKGRFISPDFKKGDFTLSTKKALQLNEMVSLPEPLQAAKAGLNVHVPLDFAKILPLNAEANLSSNIANVTMDLHYDKAITLKTQTRFPKQSLLRNFGKELNLEALNPLKTNVVMVNNTLKVDLKSRGINSDVTYDTNSSEIDGKMLIGGATFRFDGNLEKKVTLDNSVASLQSLIKEINTIYRFEAPPLDGDLKLSLELVNKKDLSLNLTSKELTYKADRKTDYVLNDTLLSLGFSDSVLKINRYHTTFQKQKIFATKPSSIAIKEGVVTIDPFWVNDELKVTGNYNLEEKKGEIFAKAKRFTIKHEIIDMQSAIDITTKLEGVKTLVNGTVTILGGNIHYNMDKKSFASDSDIIIVQDRKKEGESPFMDNLLLRIKVNTAKPLVYKTNDADIKLKADLQIEKAPKGSIFVLGTAGIEKGSYYEFETKKFVFKKSIIAFTGDPNKPILDISAVYNSLNYEITIQVTGSPETPNIIFSSIPRLSREQILSVILFDSEEAADSTDGDEMMKMMGGAMAKSVLANAGIKIDHLALGADGSMEIGKKITDKVTIIYVNDEVAGAKLQYDYSKNIKAVISTDAESSGADIIYKREFKKLPIIEGDW
jgi:translocation and assembly module TamB